MVRHFARALVASLPTFVLVAAVVARASAPVATQTHPTPTTSPSIFMMTAAPVTGGTSIMEGCDMMQPQVSVCLHPCQTSGDYWHSESVHVKSNMATQCPEIGSATLSVDPMPAGVYDVFVSNQGGGFSPIASSLFRVTSQLTPQVIYGSHLKQQIRCDDAITNANGITEVPDRSGNNNQLTQTTSGDEMQLISNNPDFNFHKTCRGDGVTQFLSLPSAMTLGPSQTGLYSFGVWKQKSTTGVGFCMNDGTRNYQVKPNASSTTSFIAGSTTVTFSSVPTLNVGSDFMAGVNGTQVSLSVDNVSAVTASLSLTLPLLVSVETLGTTCSVNSFASLDVAEVDVVDVQPTTTQALETIQYLNNTYQPYLPPTISAVNNIGADTADAGFRFLAQGLLPGFSGSLLVSGVSTPLTCDEIDSDHGECCSGTPSTPAGAANTFTITNVDSNQTSVNNLPFVDPGTDPVSSAGCGVAAWFQDSALAAGGGAPVTGSKVQTHFDLSYNTNDATNNTSTQQPTWNSSDANFGGVPTVNYNGTSDVLVKSPPRLSATPSVIAIASVCRQTTTTSSRDVAALSPGGAYILEYRTSTPFMLGNGTSVSWGSSVTGVNGLVGYGNSSNVLAVSVDGLSPASTSYTFNTGTGGNMVEGAFSNGGANFFAGACSGVAFFTVQPNIAQIHQWMQSIGSP